MTFLAMLQDGWAAYSLLATLFGLGGLGLIVGALMLGAYLPSFVRTGLFLVAAVALGIAGGLQSGQQRGAEQQRALNDARALQAERDRTAAARRVTESLATRATQDIAVEQAANRKLKELNDALLSDPLRDRECLDRGLARRLRAL